MLFLGQLKQGLIQRNKSFCFSENLAVGNARMLRLPCALLAMKAQVKVVNDADHGDGGGDDDDDDDDGGGGGGFQFSISLFQFFRTWLLMFLVLFIQLVRKTNSLVSFQFQARNSKRHKTNFHSSEFHPAVFHGKQQRCPGPHCRTQCSSCSLGGSAAKWHKCDCGDSGVITDRNTNGACARSDGFSGKQWERRAS